ncbi:MAG: HD domain-containing protein [Chitinophagaceae bacterium]|nr:MAG: HD domain-containing protein [Chitinophagaceae bacterium]
MQNKEQLESFVVNLLRERIPANYSYHNADHTLYVLDKAMELADLEELPAADKHLLKAAALMHDTGYIHVYKGHEAESCRLSKQYLPDFGFSEPEIETVCGMIMATKVPQQPTTLAQQIIADADLAYLGSASAADKAADLYQELRSVNPSLNNSSWHSQQVAFLEQHRYFTSHYREQIEPLKQAYLYRLRANDIA